MRGSLRRQGGPESTSGAPRPDRVRSVAGHAVPTASAPSRVRAAAGRRAGAARPGHGRRLRGLERRRRGRERRASSTWRRSGTREPIAALDPEDYYDFQVNRPLVDDRRGRHAAGSAGRPPGCSVARRPGTRPRRRAACTASSRPCAGAPFCAELLGARRSDLGVATVVTLGALLADTPHTRPIPVTGTVRPTRPCRRGSSSSRRTYEGPTGIVGVLAGRLRRRPASRRCRFWAAVPHYVAQPPCPKATLALLRRVEELLDVDRCPLGDLPEEARAWERRRRRAGRGGRRGRRVRPPARGGAATPPTCPRPAATRSPREFERYLRRRGTDAG